MSIWILNNNVRKAEYERGYSHAVKASPYNIDPREFGLFTDEERRANLMLGGIFGNEGSVLEAAGLGNERLDTHNLP